MHFDSKSVMNEVNTVEYARLMALETGPPWSAHEEWASAHNVWKALGGVDNGLTEPLLALNSSIDREAHPIVTYVYI